MTIKLIIISNGRIPLILVMNFLSYNLKIRKITRIPSMRFELT